MRITFLTHYCKLYGANRSLLNLIEGLRPYGVEAQVLAPCEGPVLGEMMQHGIPARRIPFRWWMADTKKERWTRLYENFRALPSLVRNIKQFKSELIYTNSSVVPAGALASMLTGLPHVWHYREFADRHYDLTFDWDGFPVRYLMRRATRRIAISNALKNYLESRHGLTDFHVVYNGIATEAQFDELRKKGPITGKRNAPYTFALIGFIHPAKGIEMAIRAFAAVSQKHPNIRLVLAGDGEKEFIEKCKALCGELSIFDRVTFTGYVPNPFDIYLNADAALMCSRDEAMGRVTVEAMAAGRPVIGYESGGTPELIQHGFTGLLFRDDAPGLAREMECLLQNSELGQKMADQAWTYARQNFSIEAYARKVWEVIALATKKK